MVVPTPPNGNAASSSTPDDVHEVTHLLRAWGSGDAQATEALARAVYAELKRQAQLALRREGGAQTLQPTALVHEAWIRLGGQHEARWQSRTQFFAVAAQMMRRVLVDHARARQAAKRGGEAVQVTLSEIDSDLDTPDALDLLALDDALARLAALDPRKAQLVELRYFAGLTIPEAAAALGVSQATIGREWTVARLWLRRELGA